MRLYNVNTDSLEIENTGNVDIDLTYGSDNDLYGSDIAILKPNEKKQMEIISYNFMTFQLDGNGTIADNNRIQLGNDGKGYFRINSRVWVWPGD